MSALSLPVSTSQIAVALPTRDSARLGSATDLLSNRPQTTRASTNSGAAASSGRASDRVTLSPEALQSGVTTAAVQGAADSADVTNQTANNLATDQTERPGAASPNQVEDEATADDIAAPRGRDGEPLTEEEVEQVRELEARDREVRQHEQAHVAAGGPYVTSGPNYEFEEGPDGRRYAVGGNVGIDVSPEDTPEATIAKAQTVRRAALAPAEPSAQDRRVAAQAVQLEREARAELAETQQAETQAQTDAPTPSTGPAPTSDNTSQSTSPADSDAGNTEAPAQPAIADFSGLLSAVSQAATTGLSAGVQQLQSAFDPPINTSTFRATA